MLREPSKAPDINTIRTSTHESPVKFFQGSQQNEHAAEPTPFFNNTTHVQRMGKKEKEKEKELVNNENNNQGGRETRSKKRKEIEEEKKREKEDDDKNKVLDKKIKRDTTIADLGLHYKTITVGKTIYHSSDWSKDIFDLDKTKSELYFSVNPSMFSNNRFSFKVKKKIMVVKLADEHNVIALYRLMKAKGDDITDTWERKMGIKGEEGNYIVKGFKTASSDDNAMAKWFRDNNIAGWTGGETGTGDGEIMILNPGEYLENGEKMKR